MSASITSPSPVTVLNSGTVVANVFKMNFVGATVVAGPAPGEVTVTVGGGGAGWALTGNALTGATPDAPNEFFGSTNDYDVIFKRNSIEYARLTPTGAVFGNPGIGPNGFYFTATTISFSFGDQNVNSIAATGTGCLVFGQCSGFNILSGGAGNLVGGRAETGDVSVGNFLGSIAFGDNIQVEASLTQAFGIGHGTVSVPGLTLIGQFSDLTAVVDSPAFVIGNGANIGAPANAFRVDKDGRETTVASQVNTAIRLVVGADTINARTDRTLICDTTTAGGNLQLPPGEKGLLFTLASSENVGGGSYLPVPDGGDVLAPNVIAITAASQQTLQFLSGVWYRVG